jgi:hypothetical protein
VRSRIALVIGILVVATAATTRADYKNEFREGVRALNGSRWDEAARRFRQAIKEQPLESTERIGVSGGEFEIYFPHALLGYALYQATKRCDQAAAAFQASRAQKSPWASLRRRDEVERAAAACPITTPGLPPGVVSGPSPEAVAALQRADKAIADAAEAQRDIATLSKDPSLAPVWPNPRLQPEQALAEGDLARARQTADAARKASDPKGAAQAEQQAISALNRFTTIRAVAKELTAPGPTTPPPDPDYKIEFREAVRAVNAGNWSEAIRRLRLAIQNQPKESGESVTVGSDVELYFPHALLGLALYQSAGRCEPAARQEFQTSRAQQATWGKLSQASAVQRAADGCVALTDSLQRADKAIADATLAQQEIAALGKDRSLVPVWTDRRLGPAQATADAELADAQRTLDASRKDFDTKGAAKAEATAVSALGKFGAIRAAARDLVPRAVPSALVTAAGQFFRAEYANAATALRAAKFDSAEDRLQAAWFQAAANFSLYLISGKRDESLRTRAEQHVRECRSIRPAFVPDRAFFSPALIAFYRAVR